METLCGNLLECISAVLEASKPHVENHSYGILAGLPHRNLLAERNT